MRAIYFLLVSLWPDIKGYGLCGLFSIWEIYSEKNLERTELLLHFQIQKFLPDSLDKYTYYVNHWKKAYVYPYFTNTNFSHSNKQSSKTNKNQQLFIVKVLLYIKCILINRKIMVCYCYSMIFLMTCKIRTSYLSILWA